jgi:mRNA-degrading endonuclease RelE of RelBE toxin-antitoxin system
LILRPDQGRVIPGSGGLRKVRWARKGGGKRGSIRVVYRWAPAERAIYVLYVYTKSEQGDLTRAQIRSLGRLVREAFQ